MSDQEPLKVSLYGTNDLDCRTRNIAVRLPGGGGPVPIADEVVFEDTGLPSQWLSRRIIAFLEGHHGQRVIIEYTEHLDDTACWVHYRLRPVT